VKAKKIKCIITQLMSLCGTFLVGYTVHGSCPRP